MPNTSSINEMENAQLLYLRELSRQLDTAFGRSSGVALYNTANKISELLSFVDLQRRAIRKSRAWDPEEFEEDNG